jgi:hypothetical protein
VTPEDAEKLRKPFATKEVGKLPKIWCRVCSDKKTQCGEHKRKRCNTCKAVVSEAHIHVDYVGHAHVTERLLAVDPLWSWEPMAMASGMPVLDQYNGMWIKLTVCGVSRLGYGHASGKTGGDAVKETIGDAIRNAAMRFGVALDLWKKEPGPTGEAVPDRPVEKVKQTPDERRAELRGQIANLGRIQSKSPAQVAAEFFEWSRGRTEIAAADEAALIEFKDQLTRPAPGGGS